MKANLPSFAHSAQGVSLIELIITLGIGSLIAAGVWATFSERQVLARSTQQSHTVEDIITLSNRAYSSSFEFGDFRDCDYDEDHPVAHDACASPLPLTNRISMGSLAFFANGDLPNGIFVDGTGYHNAFNGLWSVEANSSNGGATWDLVQVTTTQVPRAECARIVNNIAPTVYDTRVNGTLVALSPAPTGGSTGRTEVRLSQLATLCQDTNTLAFRQLKSLDYSTLRRRPYATVLNAQENVVYVPHYNRVSNALAAREVAQAAIP